MNITIEFDKYERDILIKAMELYWDKEILESGEQWENVGDENYEYAKDIDKVMSKIDLIDKLMSLQGE